ncbi:23S rRNA pseudouridine(955/2504/2580) synthase RluC [Aliikangiella sp. G2MR2-5]|uniref:23S rRNA pseudouridine(955/2504/2580) synthase RluC n=1 Tax=Aliikangiella sp. G2MR2-5 TaxID=2788943 RepID=UPI001AEDC31C
MIAVQEFNQVHFIEIDENADGQRVDNFLLKTLKGVPKSRIYRIIRKGEIRLNKKRVKAESKLRTGDSLRIPPIRLQQEDKQVDLSKFDKVQALESCIIEETNQFILLNKPSGLAVHGGSGLSFGVIEGLRALRPKEKFLELVHRLDRDTSGCLLIAKRRSFLTSCHEQLRCKKMRKEYLAVVSGAWNNQFNQVTAPLKKNQLRSGERHVTVDPEGKASDTRFKCLKRFKRHSLVRALPQTGRTHQIRVHALYAGCPLLGDFKYNDNPDEEKVAIELGLKTFLLHANKLTFNLPDSDKRLTFEAPIPPQMNNVIEKLKD